MLSNIKKEKEKAENHIYYLHIMKQLLKLKNISDLKPEYDKVINNMIEWHKLTQK
jgi:hypothetical protein